MLESGVVSLKNEVNIMMKNVVDVVLGGLTYWAFGYGLTFGDSPYSNEYFFDLTMNNQIIVLLWPRIHVTDLWLLEIGL